MKLYDEVGKEIETIAEGSYAPGVYRTELNTQQLEKGIYFYTLREGEKKFTKRLLVM